MGKINEDERKYRLGFGFKHKRLLEWFINKSAKSNNMSLPSIPSPWYVSPKSTEQWKETWMSSLFPEGT